MTETRTSLLRRVRNPADSASWAEFVGLYEPLLLSYVRQRGLNEHDARDVVQSIFITLLRKMPNFELDKSRGRFRTWLWRVSHNAVVDRARANHRIQKAEDLHRENWDEAESEPDDWVTMHRQRTLQYAMERVRDATAPKSWACFEGHILEGRSGTDVGAEVGLPANSVYVNATRVLERIREQCAAYREDLGDD
jgi:RNA polymerase sigma-70 factor (ECF subfamily)